MFSLPIISNWFYFMFCYPIYLFFSLNTDTFFFIRPLVSFSLATLFFYLIVSCHMFGSLFMFVIKNDLIPILGIANVTLSRTTGITAPLLTQVDWKHSKKC